MESQEAGFHPSHTPWKSLRDFHIPHGLFRSPHPRDRVGRCFCSVVLVTVVLLAGHCCDAQTTAGTIVGLWPTNLALYSLTHR
jgi:hypothetical protein